ncbi:MAG: beta-galactosidase, partial [Anaerolineae bacterium]|nr:beta-galactosidase [Anaerolineae bacterium]
MTQVNYDRRAITIDNQRILLLSGAVHYPRSTPEMWSQLMQRSKAAGLNTIETYVFWNLHERQRGVFDFSERLNLYHFCELAQAHDLYVILRIGPYICAETSYGGLPIWLRDLPGIQMRTCNEPFMREVDRWVRYLVRYLSPLFAPNGGPIILTQIENEYDNIAPTYAEEGQKYLEWISQLAVSLDVGIPWVMCHGAGAGTIGTINDFYGHKGLERHYREHPDQPALWTEAWPGWYNVYGYPQHVRSPQDVAYAVARFFAASGAGVNYYMWHGGTNFNREAMYLQATSYDFDAPLDEYGLLTTKSNHLKRLHHILHDLSGLLLDVEQPDVENLGPDQVAFRHRSQQGSVLFLCNDAKETASVLIAGVAHHLAPDSVRILKDGVMLIDTSEVRLEDFVTRAMQPLETVLTWMFWR